MVQDNLLDVAVDLYFSAEAAYTRTIAVNIKVQKDSSTNIRAILDLIMDEITEHTLTQKTGVKQCVLPVEDTYLKYADCCRFSSFCSKLSLAAAGKERVCVAEEEAAVRGRRTILGERRKLSLSALSISRCALCFSCCC